MQTPLKIIESYGAPTDSYIGAISYLKQEMRVPFTKEEYERNIAELLDVDTVPSYSNEKEAALYFHYLVQETIRVYMDGKIPEMDVVWDEVNRRAKEFIAEAPWSIKDYSTTETADGEKPKRKKGAKKEAAEALYKKLNDGSNDRNTIIDAFISELNMSKAGATTYFHNLKKKHGYAGPKTAPKRKKKAASPKKPAAKKVAKKKGPSKGKVAESIYIKMKGATKKDVIARIIKETGTSPAGANTYYCAAKKEHG